MLPPKRISISQFKATCLRLLEEVHQTGQPIIVTKHGRAVAQVIAPPASEREGWMGSMQGTVEVLGDIIGPVLEPGEWEGLALAEFETIEKRRKRPGAP